MVRDVAIKVLPESFANDPDRLARFSREAQALASLNHPNIAQIYGVEERALIMELVEGEALHGPLRIETALDCACQIAVALEDEFLRIALKPRLAVLPFRGKSKTGSIRHFDFRQSLRVHHFVFLDDSAFEQQESSEGIYFVRLKRPLVSQRHTAIDVVPNCRCKGRVNWHRVGVVHTGSETKNGRRRFRNFFPADERGGMHS